MTGTPMAPARTTSSGRPDTFTPDHTILPRPSSLKSALSVSCRMITSPLPAERHVPIHLPASPVPSGSIPGGTEGRDAQALHSNARTSIRLPRFIFSSPWPSIETGIGPPRSATVGELPQGAGESKRLAGFCAAQVVDFFSVGGERAARATPFWHMPSQLARRGPSKQREIAPVGEFPQGRPRSVVGFENEQLALPPH